MTNWADTNNLSSKTTWDAGLKGLIYDKLNEFEGTNRVLTKELEELRNKV